VSVILPDSTTTDLTVSSLASGASTTVNATYTVPAIAPKAAGETDAQYRARLAAFVNKKLTFAGSLTWTDVNANAYGAISAQSETTERVPILALTAGALPASVLPGETFTPNFTIQNIGTGQATNVVVRVQQPDGTEAALAPLTIEGGASAQVNASAYTLPTIPVRASGETETAYRARLATFDNKVMNVVATLNWADYGPISQQTSTLEVVPILAIAMTAPANSLSGDPITYSITLTNSGHT